VEKITTKGNELGHLLVSTMFMRSRSLLTPGDLAMSDEKQGDNGHRASSAQGWTANERTYKVAPVARGVSIHLIQEWRVGEV